MPYDEILFKYAVLNIIIAFPSAFANKRKLVKAMKRTVPALRNIAIEDSYIVSESTDAVEHASMLTNVFGVEKIAIAKRVNSRFSDLCRAIVNVGTKLIIPGHTFHVKTVIQQSARHGYASRDVEFAASGMLTARLAPINAQPAKNEEDAQDLILVVVGKEWAYVCIQISDARGGQVAGSNGPVLASIHGPLSLLSCLMATRAGFEPTIVLPYTDEADLKRITRLAQLFVTKTGIKKQRILVMPINIPVKGTRARPMKEIIISKILYARGGYSRIVLPLAAALHPLWLIELIIQQAVSAKRTPFAPLMFMSDELVTHAQELGIEEAYIFAETITAKDEFQKYNSIIESATKVAVKSTKRLDLEVGPNYLHNILDSI